MDQGGHGMKVSEMTDEQLSLAIMGALDFDWVGPPKYLYGRLCDREGNIISGEDEFSPATSYDDIHRAEMALDEGLRSEYSTQLQVVVHEWMMSNLDHFGWKQVSFYLITSTPRQRSEALCKTLGGGE
jgi:hypothetical protein